MNTDTELVQSDLFPDDELKPGEYPIPEGGKPTTCRSCGSSIVWTRTEAGRFIPLALSTARECQGRRVAMNHFTNCKHAKEWRRK